MLLRSSARARIGDFELAEQDAKAAVDLEKGSSIQVRFAFLKQCRSLISPFLTC